MVPPEVSGTDTYSRLVAIGSWYTQYALQAFPCTLAPTSKQKQAEALSQLQHANFSTES